MAGPPVLTRPTPSGDLMLRELRRRDARAWREVRSRNAAWLTPWEPTPPPGVGEQLPTYVEMVSRLRADARAGRALPWALVVGKRLSGQLTVSGITLGSLRSATIGYWIDSRLAGRGLVPMAVAMACDHCFRELGLHRIEIVIRPENVASLRVVAKLGFRHEGARPAFLHIDGAWRDHEVFALLADEAPPSMAEALATRPAMRHDAGPGPNPGPPSPPEVDSSA